MELDGKEATSSSSLAGLANVSFSLANADEGFSNFGFSIIRVGEGVSMETF